jgi:glycosyltransferase involved in cell wall biosynthesis
VILECTAIIAVKNGENYLREAISSIRNQTLEISKVIVVDDHSEDSTVELCDELGVECVASIEIGQAAATNLGISLASAPLIAILDHDDIWDSRKTELQVEHLQKNPSAQAVYSRVQNFYLDGYKSQDFGPARAFGTSMFRKEIFQSVGSIDTSISSAFFLYSFWIEVARRGIRVDCLDIPALYRRIHKTNFNVAHPKEAQLNTFGVLRSKIDLSGKSK